MNTPVCGKCKEIRTNVNSNVNYKVANVNKQRTSINVYKSKNNEKTNK